MARPTLPGNIPHRPALAAGEKSMYTTHEYLIAAHVAEPMYIGYYSALSHHGLTEQVPRTVYVVTPTRAQSREIHGVPYRVTTVTGRKFFGTTPTSIEGTTIQVSDLRRPSSIVLTIPGSVAASASSRAQCAPPTNKAVPGKPSASISSASTTAPRPSGSSTSPTSLASAFPPERGARRVVHEWLFPAGPHASRDRVDSQHVPGPHQYRAGHAGADGVLAESANSQRKAACCVTPPSIYRSLHKIR